MADTKIATLRKLQSTLDKQIDEYETLTKRDGVSPLQLARSEERINAVADDIVSQTTNHFRGALQAGHAVLRTQVLRMAIDLKLFEIVENRVSLQDLANKTGADRTLLLRILRWLVAAKYFEEPEEQTYTSTPASQPFNIPAIRDWIKLCFDTNLPIYRAIPAYVARKNFTNPSDNTDSPVHAAYGVHNKWEHFSLNPIEGEQFNSAMTLSDRFPPQMTPTYSFNPTIITSHLSSLPPQTPTLPTLVDVGGGHGQFLLDTVIKRHNLPGPLILQDLPEVTSTLPSTITSHPQISAMAHDFFHPQPASTHGAIYYHLRRILHDWPDHSCRTILQHLADAMRPNPDSRLLIQEFVLPNRGVPLFEANVDINMMTNNGMERSEKQWRSLLGEAGFEVVGIETAVIGYTSVIEARLAD